VMLLDAHKNCSTTEDSQNRAGTTVVDDIPDRILEIMHAANLIDVAKKEMPDTAMIDAYEEDICVRYQIVTNGKMSLLVLKDAQQFLDNGLECPPAHPEYGKFRDMRTKTNAPAAAVKEKTILKRAAVMAKNIRDQKPRCKQNDLSWRHQRSTDCASLSRGATAPTYSSTSIYDPTAPTLSFTAPSYSPTSPAYSFTSPSYSPTPPTFSAPSPSYPSYSPPFAQSRSAQLTPRGGTDASAAPPCMPQSSFQASQRVASARGGAARGAGKITKGAGIKKTKGTKSARKGRPRDASPAACDQFATEFELAKSFTASGEECDWGCDDEEEALGSAVGSANDFRSADTHTHRGASTGHELLGPATGSRGSFASTDHTFDLQASGIADASEGVVESTRGPFQRCRSDAAHQMPPSTYKTATLRPLDENALIDEMKRASTPDAALDVYKSNRSLYRDSPSFYLLSAQQLLAKGAPKHTCICVASNLLEMRIMDVQMLRAVGYFCLHADDKELAIRIFRKVAEMQAFEPQTDWDLAMALFFAERTRRQAVTDTNGSAQSVVRMQEAVDLMAKVLRSKDFAERFHEYEYPCLLDLNWMYNTCAQPLGIKWPDSLGPELHISDLTMEAYVKLAWDTDHTDLDLHWHECAGGDEVYYGHMKSGATGATLSKDMQHGYGPEVIACHKLRKHYKGPVNIDVKFYTSHQKSALTGATAAVVTYVENLGMAGEKVTFRTVRLRSNKQRQTVFTIPGVA